MCSLNVGAEVVPSLNVRAPLVPLTYEMHHQPPTKPDSSLFAIARLPPECAEFHRSALAFAEHLSRAVVACLDMCQLVAFDATTQDLL
jgi:hypothetical protein